MFKKVSHIILSVLLLVSTMGVAIYKHYCGGFLISTSVFTEAESCCDASDCCENEMSFYQVDEDFSMASLSEIPHSAELELLHFAVLVYNFNVIDSEETEEFFIADLPPPPKIQKVLSKNQTYLL
ncbi:MAG: hypothetical protein HN778_07805 [Prolixibacteraceae bacterium]|jgi:hypothetical protein|nr:hypothetical protein [Prolixibacteraceae bacterium]MBT6997706.1 hypothetical protein [Prolixibacteraceae bacterium]MBT7394722.1 hypothetical protein [Prolixibacteraceae bacterium]